MLLISPGCAGCGDRRWYVCPSCLDRLQPAPRLDVAGAASASGVVAYEPPATKLVIEAKGRTGRVLIDWWADAIAANCPDDLDLITWIPASGEGKRLRGHDQGRLLAMAIGRRLGRRPQATLRRLDSGHQSRRRLSERAGIALDSVRELSGERVLLVDDVHTTGASCATGVKRLLQARAGRVDVRVVAVVADRARGRRQRAYSEPYNQPDGGASWT